MSTPPKPMFCECCRISLFNEHDRKAHFSGKKHKQNEGIALAVKNAVSRTLHVSGTNGLIEMQLQDYFSQFGPISKVHLDPKKGSYAFVEFTREESQQACLKVKNHRVYDKHLQVSPKMFKPFYAKTNTTMTSENKHLTPFDLNHFEVVMVKLKEFKSVKDQMLKLSWLAILTPDEMRARLQFARMIEKHIRTIFPNSSVYIYGSCGSGFGFKGCDIDFSVNIPEYDASLPRDEISGTPSLQDIRNGAVNWEDLVQRLSLRWMLQFLKKVMSVVPKVSRTMVIPSARYPILRFLHTQMKITCDMSINKLVGISNTKLLKHYGRLDVRVRPLLLTLRYWAKIKDLLQSSHKLSSYAFSWLVIFYLQNRNPPIVPSVETLQKLAGEERIVDGHNVAFCDNYDEIPKTKNTENIVDLLKGFFQYYYTFDFTMNAICPYTGKTIDRAMLKEQNIHNKDFKLSPITVQDPFELERNITVNATAGSVVEIIEMIEKAHKICVSGELDEQGLTVLFGTESPTDTKAKKRKLSKIDKQDMIFTIPFNDKVIDVMRPEIDSSDSQNSAEQIVNEIFKLACRAVYNILEEGLLMTCEVKENNLNNLDVAENSTQSTGYSSQSTDNVSQNAENSSQSTENVSQSIGYSSQSTENVSQSIGYSSQSTENVSQSIGYSSQSTENASQSTGYSSQSTENVSQSIGYSSQSSENVSQSIGYSSQSTENLSQNAEKSSQSTANSSQNTEKSSQSTPFYQSTANSSRNTEKSSQSTENSGEPSEKSQKLSTGEKSTDSLTPLMLISCGAHYKTWQGRRSKKPDASFPISPIDGEKQISLAIIEESHQEKNAKPYFVFDVELFKQKKGAMNLLRVCLIEKQDNKEFKKCVSVFLSSYIPKIVEACLIYAPSNTV